LPGASRNPKIGHGRNRIDFGFGNRSRSWCPGGQAPDAGSSPPAGGGVSPDPNHPNVFNCLGLRNYPAVHLESTELDGITQGAGKNTWAVGYPARLRLRGFLDKILLEPGQSLLALETGSGEESPDTTGYSAPGNRGRFGGDPQPTESVTENRPPCVASVMWGKGETVG